MNTKITALTLAAATAFAFTPKPASAGNGEGAAIFGAIVGGALIGAAIASANNDCAPVYVNSSAYCPPAPVYVTGGYWTTTTVNVWVPAGWVVEHDRYGRDCRRYVAGHYAPHANRVWVANNRYDNRGGNNHREVAGGYGHERNDNRHDNRNDSRSDNHGDHR